MLYCDFFELLVEVTGGDIGAALCSGLELPFDSSPGNDEGGVGGRPKPGGERIALNERFKIKIGKDLLEL